MANDTIINITEPLSGDWMPDTQDCQFCLKIDDTNKLHLIVPDQKIGDLIYALQRLQNLALEQRKKAGLPVIATTFVGDIKNLEYLRDDINQIAVIKSHYTDGTSDNMPIEKQWLKSTIAFLVDALQAFENQSPSQVH